ncbi:MAG: hypothetical protein AB8B77_08360 [Alphaproteobacteria bacterium]
MLYLLLIMACMNGIFSPYLYDLIPYAPFWLPLLPVSSPNMAFFISSFMLSSLSLIICGLPAALYQRFSENPRPIYSNGLMLITMLFLCFPAMLRLALVMLSAYNA